MRDQHMRGQLYSKNTWCTCVVQYTANHTWCTCVVNYTAKHTWCTCVVNYTAKHTCCACVIIYSYLLSYSTAHIPAHTLGFSIDAFFSWWTRFLTFILCCI